MTPDETVLRYISENLAQPEAEEDLYSLERYRQFSKHLPDSVQTVLDVGCATGRGGMELARLNPGMTLWGLDVVQERLDALPDTYSHRLNALSVDIPVPDRTFDVVLAGEFLEHLLPRDVDPTLCEFQRVLRLGGRLLLTTPNPRYVRLTMTGRSVLGPGHLTQHFPLLLRKRLMSHGFKKVRLYGSGRMTRVLGEIFPVPYFYGSYLVIADKV